MVFKSCSVLPGPASPSWFSESSTNTIVLSALWHFFASVDPSLGVIFSHGCCSYFFSSMQNILHSCYPQPNDFFFLYLAFMTNQFPLGLKLICFSQGKIPWNPKSFLRTWPTQHIDYHLRNAYYRGSTSSEERYTRGHIVIS